MSLPLLVSVLTALGALVVVLTRVRLTRAGAPEVSAGVLNAHTGTGAAAVVLWTAFLLLDGTRTWVALVGIVAVGFWWLVAGLGVVILSRWLTRRRGAGRRTAEASAADSWSDGPGLSVLAHVGMVVGVVVFTYAYLTAAV